MDEEGNHREAERRPRVAHHRPGHPHRETELDRQLGQSVATRLGEHDPDDDLGVRASSRPGLGVAEIVLDNRSRSWRRTIWKGLPK